MRTISSAAVVLLAGCGCGPQRDANAHFSEAMIGKPDSSERFRDAMRAALERYQAALEECRLTAMERGRIITMIVRCHLELDQFDEGTKWIREMAEVLDKSFGEAPMTGDRIAVDLIRAQYSVFVGRRALSGLEESATDAYADMKLRLSMGHYDEALDLLRGLAAVEDPEIARFAALREAEASLELARGHFMPKTMARRKNYDRARELLTGALEKVRRHSGPPLQAELDRLRPEIVKDLEWVEGALRR
jgi:tetratricopeptide (TPR) repeat protein